MNKRKFNVMIQETLMKCVTVKARDEYEACQIVREKYKNEEYVLDYKDFVGVNFTVIDNNSNEVILKISGGESLNDVVDTVQTKVIEIKWKVNENGYVVPEVFFNPIDFGNDTENSCSGYNARYIKENMIGEGSIVRIGKQDNNIPFIYRIIAMSDECKLPEFCPLCHCGLKWCDDNLYCENSHDDLHINTK